jgi:hypothetical protein
MGIRAHRVIEIKLAEYSSFSLWDNSKIMEFLENKTDFVYKLNSEGTGEAEIPVNVLKKLIKMSIKLNIDEETRNRLQEDIDFADSNNNDYVLYECF